MKEITFQNFIMLHSVYKGGAENVELHDRSLATLKTLPQILSTDATFLPL